MLRVALMATWFGKKAKKTVALGVDSFAPLLITKVGNQSVQPFGTTLDLMANGNVRN